MFGASLAVPVAVSYPIRTPFPPPPQREPVAAVLGFSPDRGWDLLMICLVGHILNAVGRLNNLYDFLKPLHLVLVFAGAALLLYVLGGGSTRRLAPVLRSTTTRCALGLGVWMALSIPGALWQGGAFQEFTDEFGKGVIMFVVIAGAARGFRDVERLTFAYLVCAAFYAAVVLSRFVVTGGAQWRLGSLYYYDANEFATLAVMCMPIAVYFVIQRKSLWQRIAGAAALLLLLRVFVWAGSRGGFLALIAVGAFLLIRYRSIPIRWRVLTTALLALAFAATASDTYWEKMRTITQPGSDYNVTDEGGRLQIWKRGIGYMLRNPLFGVGAGNFPTAEGTISVVARTAPIGKGVKWYEAHNSFVQVGAELGVPGLLLFVAMLASAFRMLAVVRRTVQRSTRDRSPPPAALAETLQASLVGYVVGGFFLSLAYRDLLLVLLGIVVAFWKVTAGLAQRDIRWS